MSQEQDRSGVDPRMAGKDPELVDALAKLSQGLGKGEDPLYYDWRNGSREPMPKRRPSRTRARALAVVLFALMICVALFAAFAWPRYQVQPVPGIATTSAPSVASSQAAPATSPAPAISSEPVVVPSATQKPPRTADAGAAISAPPPATTTGHVPVGPAVF